MENKPYTLCVARGGNDWAHVQEFVPVELLRHEGEGKLTRIHFYWWRRTGALWYIVVTPYNRDLPEPKAYTSYGSLMTALYRMGVEIHPSYWRPPQCRAKTP